MILHFLYSRLHSQLKELSEGGVNGGLATRNAIENDEQMRILRVCALRHFLREHGASMEDRKCTLLGIAGRMHASCLCVNVISE